LTGSKKRKKPIRDLETIDEEAQTLGLLDKDFNSTILNMLKELRETMTKKQKTKNKKKPRK
jgi:hypothetical protein